MIHRVNKVRDRITDWAARHHTQELTQSVELFLGDQLRDEQTVMTAAAFALISAPPGGQSLIERYAATQRQLPRAERELFAQWSRSTFGFLRVSRVLPGVGIDLHDVLFQRSFRAHERAAADQLEPGTWLAAFYFEDQGSYTLEGAIMAVPDTARILALQAALRALAEQGVLPERATPAQTRQAARPAIEAMHLGSRAAPVLDRAGQDRLSQALLTADSFGWSVQPLPILGGLSASQAHAQGRDAEIWALLPADPSAEPMARSLGLWVPET